ncbi:hypothetical protein [Nostoc sp. UHCC 0251]|uniref:hypothetical protein n=1 Tax=Nostoc sp. UHCC 0251 TaxID=3110240 RepID=UPI002B1F361A|nr:hypothetical protein [Nostoc sp. UHCC 0251]MEA5626891.1 hypothetical protein [Nostoc sp. UHCC 0251]
MTDLPIFERLPINEQTENNDKEIWQPSWHCFCCQDTGLIYRHLIELIIPDFDPNRDRIPVCQGCNKFDNYHLKEYGVLDLRFDLYICKKLDAIARDGWKRTTQQQFEKYKNQLDIATGAIAQSHSLAVTNRTSNDDREVAQRKAEIQAITPEQWEAMNKTYLVGSNKNE